MGKIFIWVFPKIPQNGWFSTKTGSKPYEQMGWFGGVLQKTPTPIFGSTPIKASGATNLRPLMRQVQRAAAGAAGAAVAVAVTGQPGAKGRFLLFFFVGDGMGFSWDLWDFLGKHFFFGTWRERDEIVSWCWKIFASWNLFLLLSFFFFHFSFF